MERDEVVDTIDYLIEAFDAEEGNAELSLSSAERREQYAQTMREM